jgi:hypothetical protein
MRSLSRLVPFAIAGMLGGTAACGGGDSTGPKAGSVTGVAGDGQTGPTGATLSAPLSFTVLGSDGFPLNHAKISWSVSPAVAASVDPKDQTTDASGIASTSVTLGSVVGQLTVTAKVNGVSPVQFQITALNPCNYLAPYSLGATASGSLTRLDCKVNGYFYDFYQLDRPTGQSSIRIDMRSTKFDPYLEFFKLTGEILGADDDSVQNVAQNAQLDIVLGSGGTFVIGANSYDPDTTGPYTLTTSTRPTSITGCGDVWVTPGVTIIDTIRTTDCQIPAGGSYFDRLLMFIPGGTVLKLAQRSTALNASMSLDSANFTTGNWDLAASNDDSSATNTNAFISLTVPNDALMRLTLGASVPGQTGEYTFAFSGNTTGPTAGKAPPTNVPQMLRFFPLHPSKGWKAKR